MYKVLIADDENWVVESLKNTIRWNDFGFEIAGAAYNGVEAYEMIEQLLPDVIFTDIRMPKMNGLELIKKVNESSYNIPVIVISGHADFTYAQKALNYGAVGYCLKPFDEDEIIEMLGKAKQILKRNKADEGLKLLELLEGTDNGCLADIGKILERIGINPGEQQGVIILISIGQGELRFPENIKSFMIKSGMFKRIYLLQTENMESVKEISTGQLSENIKGIGIGNIIHKTSELKKAIGDAQIAAYQFFISGLGGVYEGAYFDSKVIHDSFKLFDESIRFKDIVSIGKAFDMVSKYFETGKFNILHAYYLYNLTMSFLYDNSGDNKENYLFSYEQLEKYFGNVQEMLENLKSLLIKNLDMKPDRLLETVKNDTCKSILKYVNNNFYKDISLQSLSQEFFINPVYIGQLFKKETGITLIEYIIKLRIDYACELLKKGDLPIGEIAEKAGYGDYFYFCKSFKKITGKTPTQYREE